MRNPLLASIALLAATTAAHAGPPTQILGRVTDPRTHEPVEGVVVTIAADGAAPIERVTSNAGLYRTVVPPGEYTVTFIYGDKVTAKRVAIEEGRAVTVDAVTAPADETIVIEGRIRPAVIPRPKKDPRILPKYSDTAIDQDAWAKAWLLLDIDVRGDVRRVKFLKRPGYDLDKIALKAALDTHFEPALDATGHAVPTLMVWPIEWPSYWWMVALEGTVTRRPKEAPLDLDRFAPRIDNYLSFVPCASSGRPLKLGSVHPVYRDCEGPDMTNVDREPWVDVASLRR